MEKSYFSEKSEIETNMYVTIPYCNFQQAHLHLLPALRYLVTFIQL